MMISRPSSRFTAAEAASCRREAPARTAAATDQPTCSATATQSASQQGARHVQAQQRADGHGDGGRDGGLQDRPLVAAHVQHGTAVYGLLRQSRPEQLRVHVCEPEHRTGQQQQQREFHPGQRTQGSGADHHGGGEHGAVDAAGVVGAGPVLTAPCPACGSAGRGHHVPPPDSARRSGLPAGAPGSASGGRPVRAVGRCEVTRKLASVIPPVARIAAFSPSSWADA